MLVDSSVIPQGGLGMELLFRPENSECTHLEPKNILVSKEDQGEYSVQTLVNIP